MLSQNKYKNLRTKIICWFQEHPSSSTLLSKGDTAHLLSSHPQVSCWGPPLLGAVSSAAGGFYRIEMVSLQAQMIFKDDIDFCLLKINLNWWDLNEFFLSFLAKKWQGGGAVR